ncbi:shikimate kinase [Modestobacter versicolor]|uniref:Shikimate kinase n=1 Tax=Modestobacter versicolor TaxID=429133 RepID=A0A323V5I4_9ACTN|nr:shikimate kinase [Modestobacter versicolor]MBB3675496.1 shikimate kinase [Modestobacter versicolor]PZA19874.1 shikimate kinase [Modestobacter versicolor]
MSGPVLVLVGPPAAGKTTVGTRVAGQLGVPFRDTDADVEQQTGTTVADLFVQQGEPHFRALEEQAVARALAEHTGVLALGGGAVTSTATRELLVAHGRAGGVVVWLDVDLPSAAKRVGLSRDRPVLGVNPRAMLRQMLETRAPLYAEVSSATVPTGGREPADVVADVAALVAAAGTAR